MSFGQLAVLFSLFSGVWLGSMHIIDTRNEVRIHHMTDTLAHKITKKVTRYENVYTVEEILELVKGKHSKDIEDIKTLIVDGNKKQDKALSMFVKIEKAKYDTIYLEESINKKYMLVGNLVWDKFYMMKKVKLDKFPFE